MSDGLIEVKERDSLMSYEEVCEARTDRTSMLQMQKGVTDLSIIIPAYNEELHIGETLTEVLNYTGGDKRVVEIIVVDDGSTDQTASLVQAQMSAYAAAGVELRLVRHEVNQGKGAAVRNGILSAAAGIALFTDADLSSPIESVPQLVEPIVSGECDIAIASRALDRSLIEVRQGWFRETAGKVFNLVVRVVTGLPIQDTQCGFKAFRREAILPALRMQRIGDFAFDVELLFLARKLGLRIRELPVPWRHVEHSKVKMLRDSYRMFRDVLRIRLNDLMRRYRPESG